MPCGVTATVGSNPTLSALYLRLALTFGRGVNWEASHPMARSTVSRLCQSARRIGNHKLPQSPPRHVPEKGSSNTGGRRATSFLTIQLDTAHLATGLLIIQMVVVFYHPAVLVPKPSHDNALRNPSVRAQRAEEMAERVKSAVGKSNFALR